MLFLSRNITRSSKELCLSWYNLWYSTHTAEAQKHFEKSMTPGLYSKNMYYAFQIGNSGYMFIQRGYKLDHLSILVSYSWPTCCKNHPSKPTVIVAHTCSAMVKWHLIWISITDCSCSYCHIHRDGSLVIVAHVAAEKSVGRDQS